MFTRVQSRSLASLSGLQLLLAFGIGPACSAEAAVAQSDRSLAGTEWIEPVDVATQRGYKGRTHSVRFGHDGGYEMSDGCGDLLGARYEVSGQVIRVMGGFVTLPVCPEGARSVLFGESELRFVISGRTLRLTAPSGASQLFVAK